MPMKDENNFRFLTYDEIAHKDLMRFYVKEFVDDKEISNYRGDGSLSSYIKKTGGK